MRAIIQFFRESLDFFVQIFRNRNLLSALSLREFRKLYIQNFFGLIWAVLDPLAFIVIMYFVFGPRYGSSGGHAIPFYVYLITGYIIFDFFSNSLTSVTIAIKEHSYLLKKVNFRVAILPIVAILSRLMMHGILLTLGIGVLLINKVYPTWYWLQVFYYLAAVSVLLVSAGWLVSSIYLFFPDIRNIIGIITRIMFFVTPIFWKMEDVLPANRAVLKFNPIYYIVNGYRDSLLHHTGFWEHPLLSAYFWGFCLVLMMAGVIVFKRLRPHFADVVA